MTVTAPETALRARLIGILTTEFTPETIEFRNDKLHDSLGQDAPIGAVYPNTSAEGFQQGLVLATTVTVQLFNRWQREVNAEEIVDPSLIEEWAERLRRRVNIDNQGAPGTEHLWYYRVLRIDYPEDPTGNISRLLATVEASSQNSGLVESTG